MKNALFAGTVFVVGAISLSAIPDPAHAITCRDEVQINKNSRAITPYCETEYLARVARSYGFKITGRAIRANGSLKRDVCQFVGGDIRVSIICQGLRFEGNGGVN